MRNTAPNFRKTAPANNYHDEAISSVQVDQLQRLREDWNFDGEYSQRSQRTLESRISILDKLEWFCKRQGFSDCGTSELRQFLIYVRNGHKEPGGRWGNPLMTRPVRPITVKDYFTVLRAFFNWLVKKGEIDVSPVEFLEPPKASSDQVHPFTPEQQRALLQAARNSLHPRRDEAIITLLLDCGLRASELCGLCFNDLDIDNRCLTVLGKGNKRRTIYFSRSTAKALWHYLREQPRDGHEPVFLSDRGVCSGEPLTRSGLLQLVRRLGAKARLQAVRCSPHTFRHTFAVEFLRAGGNLFTLQQILGHTGLTQTQRYVALAQADIQNQHRQFSPVERLKRNDK